MCTTRCKFHESKPKLLKGPQKTADHASTLREDVGNLLLLRAGQDSGEDNLYFDVQITKCGRVIPQWHAFASNLDDLKRLGNAVGTNLNGVAVHVPDGLCPTEEGFLKCHLGVHVQVISPSLEVRVFGHLQRQDHAARYHAWPLIGHAWKCETFTVSHSLFYVCIDLGYLLLAFLLTLDFLLLLHEHARANLPIHQPNFVWTSVAALALWRVGLHSASSADNAALDLGLSVATIVQVF
mmetsp:Transcript_54938/g.102908  ORF Transcript_54938/g.102908 Transcript_54938/m.102908 type:complete len:238 (-) Transcript_54938:790-1503(-)